jgi:hypothetical protein
MEGNTRLVCRPAVRIGRHFQNVGGHSVYITYESVGESGGRRVANVNYSVAQIWQWHTRPCGTYEATLRWNLLDHSLEVLEPPIATAATGWAFQHRSRFSCSRLPVSHIVEWSTGSGLHSPA